MAMTAVLVTTESAFVYLQNLEYPGVGSFDQMTGAGGIHMRVGKIVIWFACELYYK